MFPGKFFTASKPIENRSKPTKKTSVLRLQNRYKCHVGREYVHYLLTECIRMRDQLIRWRNYSFRGTVYVLLFLTWLGRLGNGEVRPRMTRFSDIYFLQFRVKVRVDGIVITITRFRLVEPVTHKTFNPYPIINSA